MAVVDSNLLGIAGLDDIRVVGRCRDQLGIIWFSRLGRLRGLILRVFLHDEDSVGDVRLAALRGHRYRNLDVVAGLRRRRCSCRHPAVLVNGDGPAVHVRWHLIGVAVRVLLYVLRLRLARLNQLNTVEGALQFRIRVRGRLLLRHRRGGVAGLGNLLRRGDLRGLRDGLGTDAQLAWRRFLGHILVGLRATDRNTVLQLPDLGDLLLSEGTRLLLNDLSSLEVRVSLNESIERDALLVLIGQLSLRRGRPDLDDALGRLADDLRGIFSSDFTILRLHVDGVLDRARLSFLDDLGLTRLEFRVNPNLNFEWGVFGPLDGLGRGLALSADLDDLLDRLGHALGLGLGTDNIRVLNLLSRRYLVLARLTFLNRFLGAGLHGVVELNLGFEWNVNLGHCLMRALGLGTHTNLGRNRLLGALSRHGRLAERLAIHDLLSRGLDISAELTLLVDDLLACLQVRVRGNLRLERHRLLSLGYHRGVFSLRAVLDDALDRFSAGLDFLNLCFNVGAGKDCSIGSLAVLAFLNHPSLTRSEVRVRTQSRAEWNRLLPLDRIGRSGLLGTNGDDLVDRLLRDLFRDRRLTVRVRVGDVALDRHRLLTRNTWRRHLGLTSRHVRVVLDDDLERSFRLEGFDVLTSGLATNADDLLDRSLSPFLGDYRITGRYSVDKLLLSRNGLFAFFTLLFNDLLASLKSVVINDLSLERDAVLVSENQFLILKARAVLHNAWLRILGHGIRRGLHRWNTARLKGGVEFRSDGVLASFALLNNLHLTRLECRVRTHDGVETSRHLPSHFIGSLCRLGTNDDDLIDRSLGLRPLALSVLYLCAWNTFGFDLVGALRDGVIELVLNIERHLARRGILDVDRCINPIGGTVGVGNRDRNLDRVTRLRGLRCSSNYVALVIQADQPIAVGRRNRVRRITKLVFIPGCSVAISRSDLVRLIRRHGNTFRQLNSERRSNRLTRERSLRRVGWIDLEVLSQVHHSGYWSLVGRTIGVRHRDVVYVLVTRLRVSGRGYGNLTGLRIDLVGPPVNGVLSFRLVAVQAEGEGRTVRRTVPVNGTLHLGAWLG